MNTSLLFLGSNIIILMNKISPKHKALVVSHIQLGVFNLHLKFLVTIREILIIDELIRIHNIILILSSPPLQIQL